MRGLFVLSTPASRWHTFLNFSCGDRTVKPSLTKVHDAEDCFERCEASQACVALTWESQLDLKQCWLHSHGDFYLKSCYDQAGLHTSIKASGGALPEEGVVWNTLAIHNCLSGNGAPRAWGRLLEMSSEYLSARAEFRLDLGEFARTLSMCRRFEELAGEDGPMRLLREYVVCTQTFDLSNPDMCLFGHAMVRYLEALTGFRHDPSRSRHDLLLEVYSLLDAAYLIDMTIWGAYLDWYVLLEVMQHTTACGVASPPWTAMPPNAHFQSVYMAYLAPDMHMHIPLHESVKMKAMLVGDHATLALELQHTLTATLASFELTFAMHGHYHYCRFLEGGCENPLARELQAIAEDISAGRADLSLSSFRGRVFSHLQPAIDEYKPDIILCSRWTALCMSLRPVIAGSVPMVHYAHKLWRHCPEDPPQWHAELHDTFVRLATQTASDVVLAMSPVEAELVRQLTGVVIPVVQPLNLYAAKHRQRKERERIQLLVARSHFAFSRQGVIWNRMLTVVLESVQDLDWDVKSHSWNADDINRFSSLRNIPVAHLTFAEMSLFSAAIFIPAIVQQMTFNDIYALSVPLWVPDSRLWTRTFFAEQDCERQPRWWNMSKDVRGHRRMATSWDVFHGPGKDDPMLEEGLKILQDPMTGLSQQEFWFSRPLASDGDVNELILDYNCDGPRKAEAWYWLTDYAHYPGVGKFYSVADLVHQVSAADLLAIEEKMQHYSANLMKRSAAFWFSLLGLGNFG